MSRPFLPESELRRMIAIRIHPDILKRLDDLADAEEVSRARMVERLVERAPTPAKKKKRVPKKDPNEG